MYLLFDCNNFFASCEQVFRPDWRKRPLVVLSNNDGCVISRSAEAKALGIPMGAPWFRCREVLERARAVVCSANFSLYGDLSDRIMSILEEHLPEVAQYSIDEAFARVSPREGQDWEEACRRLRRLIRRWTGVTVSVGLAPTRTLAKLANETAKKRVEFRGVLSLPDAERWESLLEETPVEDVWGVGRRLAPRMRALGIRTAAGLSRFGLSRLRKHFGVQGERLALELQGKDCLEDEAPAPRSQVMVSRTLSEGVTEFALLRDVLCRFVEKAGRTLRREALVASEVAVVLRTSRFADSSRLYIGHRSSTLEYPSDDTRELTKAAVDLLTQLYRPGFSYRKLGVWMGGLQESRAVQPTFEHPQVETSPLMRVLDCLQQAGHPVHFANQSGITPWKRSHVSPCYTTSWEDIPEAH